MARTSITKLELQQQLAHISEEYRAARERIAALEMDLEIARKKNAPTTNAAPSASSLPSATNFASYYDYVGACRAHAKRNRQRVVTYMSVAQFNEVHGAQHVATH